MEEALYTSTGVAIPSPVSDGEYDWDWNDDYEDEDDDYTDTDDEFGADDVVSTPCSPSCGCNPEPNYLAVKPATSTQAGRPYHNKRDKGRFTAR